MHVNWPLVLPTTDDFNKLLKLRLYCHAAGSQILQFWLTGGTTSQTCSHVFLVLCKSCRLKEPFSQMAYYGDDTAVIGGLSLISQ